MKNLALRVDEVRGDKNEEAPGIADSGLLMYAASVPIEFCDISDMEEHFLGKIGQRISEINSEICTGKEKNEQN